MPVKKQAKVKPIAQMDPDTVIKHVNARHTPIAGLQAVGRSNVPDDEDEHLLRVWHDKQHQLREPHDHYHETEDE